MTPLLDTSNTEINSFHALQQECERLRAENTRLWLVCGQQDVKPSDELPSGEIEDRTTAVDIEVAIFTPF